MRLTVLSVAYPLAPVGADSVGGAEQILSILDRALVARGHVSIVVACEGSQTAGRLIATPSFPSPYGDRVKKAAQQGHARTITGVLAQQHVDLVHMHALDFEHFLPGTPVPVLATLHLPLSCYSGTALHPERRNTWLQCVSQAQHDGAGANPHLLPPIPNGVELNRFGGFGKCRFALFLGRICPEKGVHLAIEAARRAGMPLLVAGRVFDYPAHRDYFDEQIAPRLSRDIRFVGPLAGRAKRRALAMARCLLVPSLIAETSSLVAREAAASGTPVVAFRSGALSEAIVDGHTGYLVDDAAAMTDAISQIGKINPETCRRHAERHFSADQMVEGYLKTYRTILER